MKCIIPSNKQNLILEQVFDYYHLFPSDLVKNIVKSAKNIHMIISVFNKDLYWSINVTKKASIMNNSRVARKLVLLK